MDNTKDNTEQVNGSNCLSLLVLRFLSGERVSRLSGGDPDDESNYLHVEWGGNDGPVLWYGFGSYFVDERIVLEVMKRPEEWVILPQNAQSSDT